jgi:hypothetical protein
MDAQLDKFMEDSSARYVAAKNEGQRNIRERWRMLATETRTALVDSGFYSPRGERLDIEGPATSFPQHDAERLEQAVGVFKLCLAAKLPLATDKGQPIPYEAHADEVMSAAGELLFVRDWQDPNFLRLALRAISKHQQANALCMHTPQSTLAPAWGCLGALFKAGLFLAMPAALAAGLAASARQDVGGAALAFYVVGFGVLAILSTAGIGVKKKDGFELAFDRWSRFQMNDAAGVTGAGALEHLRRMAQDGVSVPSIAFDVADTLRCRMADGFSESIKAATAEA